MSGVEVLPADLLAAAGPLRSAGAALRDLADHRRALLRMVDAAPSEVVRAAVADFVRTGELAVWELSQTLTWVSRHLLEAEAWYGRTEAAVTRAVPLPVARPDLPDLRPPMLTAPTPHPQPGPAAGPAGLG